MSPQRVNPVTAEGEVRPTRSTFREKLKKAHGILMIIAWPVLGGVAAFFAAWMKAVLPNGEWFQVRLRTASIRSGIHVTVMNV